MAGRILAQIILAGGTFMVRTFAQAYRQAIVNAQAGGGGTAASASRAVARGQMTAEEAAQILGVDKNSVKLEKLEDKFKRLWDQNNPEKGGSPYLQYKILGAKEVLEKECIARGEKPAEQERTAEKNTKKVEGKR